MKINFSPKMTKYDEYHYKVTINYNLPFYILSNVEPLRPKRRKNYCLAPWPITFRLAYFYRRVNFLDKNTLGNLVVHYALDHNMRVVGYRKMLYRIPVNHIWGLITCVLSITECLTSSGSEFKILYTLKLRLKYYCNL